MVQMSRRSWWPVWLAVVAGLIGLIVLLARPADPQRMVRRMQTQVAKVRGLQFKHDVVVLEQSPDDYLKQTENRLQQLGVPKNEQLLRTLGLLASDETLGIEGMRAQLSVKTAAGHYDPNSDRLLIVRTPGQPQLQRSDDLYSRELYRALIDQHFDLATYLNRSRSGDALNSDARLARQIAVEGEVLYASVLRQVQLKLGHIPKNLPLEQAFGPLGGLVDTDELVDIWSDPRMRESLGSGRKPQREPGGVPTFVAQLAKTVRRDSLMFSHELHDRGWSEVDKLYKTSPPISTEQILHPEKWFTRERPVTIQWPEFASNAALADWELVEQDVLGELMLRTVFRVHHLTSMVGLSSAPAGWNGDRFAVLKRRDSGEMMLLLYTVWDEEPNAAAFAETYQFLVKEKYAEAPTPVRIVEEGRRVVIVEGGDEASIDKVMQFAQSAQVIDEPMVEM